jgi:hypothetical protein
MRPGDGNEIPGRIGALEKSGNSTSLKEIFFQ